MRVGPGLQCPAPSHAYEPTTASPSQLPDLHIVLAGYLRQPPVPSHVPSSPHVDAGDITHVFEFNRGSSPDERFTQVPTEPGALQVLQPSLQAMSQQTPSVQAPLAHCLSQVQASALVFVPATHGGPASDPSGPSNRPSMVPTLSTDASDASALSEPDFLQPIALKQRAVNTIAARATRLAPIRANLI